MDRRLTAEGNEYADVDALIGTEEFHDLCTEKDEMEMAWSHVADREERQSDYNVMRKHYNKRVTAHIQKTKGKGAKPKNVGPAPKKAKKIEACPIPADDSLVPQDAVTGLCPDGARVHKDYFNGRWRIYWRFTAGFDWHHVSRSWGRRSSKEAAMICLKVVWSWAEVFDMPCPHQAINEFTFHEA